MPQEGKAPLPLARTRAATSMLPDAQAIGKLFTIATNPEVAQYFRDKLVEQVQSAGKMKEFDSVLKEVNDFLSIVRSQSTTRSDWWSGKAKDKVLTSFRQFQQNLSDSAAAELTKLLEDIPEFDFNFAMAEDSTLLQGAFINQEPVEEDIQMQINKIYSDWLTKHKMLCEDGVIYHSDDDGNKTETKVAPQEYKALFENKENGFCAFVKEKAKLSVNVNDLSAEMPAPEKASASSSSSSSG